MPASRNLRGGKAFKKGKKPAAGTDEKVPKFFGRDADQDYARAVAMLGHRRVRCLCNDGKERICKIRGSLCKGPKKQKIEVGDIVLISYRAFEDADSDSDEDVSGNLAGKSQSQSQSDVADIMYKYSRAHWRDIRKEDGIHHNLFLAEQSGGGEGLDELFDPEAEAEAEAEAEEAKPDDEEVDIDAV
jgi:initiation factor 1A